MGQRGLWQRVADLTVLDFRSLWARPGGTVPVTLRLGPVWWMKMDRGQNARGSRLGDRPGVHGNIVPRIHLNLRKGCRLPAEGYGRDGNNDACPGKPAEGNLGHEPSLARLRGHTLGAACAGLNRASAAAPLCRHS